MLRRLLASSGLGLVALLFVGSAAFAQMPQPDTTKLLSASEVSQEEIQKAARIAVSVRMSTRKDRMKMRRDMKQKYGNPQEMDSTEKAKARKEIRRRQMKMRKKQMRIMRKQAKKEDLSPQKFQKIMQSARQDSTLKKQLQTAMKAEMQKQMKGQSQGSRNPNPQNQ